MQVESRKLPNWARVFAVFVGLISLIAGLLVLVFPGLGVLFVVYLVAFAFVMLGIERLAMGVTGHAYVVQQEKQK